MEISAIKNWLQWLGADFDILEAHNRFRSGMKPPADYFTFRILSSQATDDNAVIDKTASSYDNSVTYSKRYKTIVEVTCHSEQAVTVLQSLDSCTTADAVKAFFGDSVTCLGLVAPIVDSTEHDQTYGEVARETQYSTSFEFNEIVTYTRTITNDIWDTYTMTGTLTDDNDDDITVTATNS